MISKLSKLYNVVQLVACIEFPLPSPPLLLYMGRTQNPIKKIGLTMFKGIFTDLEEQMGSMVDDH